jgi:hypothetical protein
MRGTVFALNLAFSWVFFIHNVPAEEIIINLAGGQRDPLVEFVPPTTGSPDRALFAPKGLRIQQKPETEKHRSGTTGFKTLLPARGDFRVELRAEIYRLEPTRKDWGQGLVFIVLLDDPKQTAIKLSQVALAPDGQQMTMTEFLQNGKATYETYPIALRHGSLIISRSGSKANLFLLKDGVEHVTGV